MPHDGAAILGTLRRLHGLGVLIATNDFGTGYPSLGAPEWQGDGPAASAPPRATPARSGA
jgi:hypothetical protein